MPLSTTSTAYGAVTKGFHWITALLILTAIPLGLIGDELAQEIRQTDAGGDQALIDRAVLVFSLHKTIGLAAFFTAALRILWAIGQPKPGLLNGGRWAEATLAETIHWALYGAMLITPLAGWVTHSAETGFAPIWWPFGQNLPFVPKDAAIAGAAGMVHFLSSQVLIGAIVLHLAGALKHHLIDRDATLRRMLPGQTDAMPSPQQPGHTAPVLAAIAIWVGVLAAGIAPALGNAGGDEAGAPAMTSAAAGNWQVEGGTLAISITQMGNTVTGEFAQWQADITFADDPNTARNGDVEVSIAIPSLTLGSVSDQAMGADFFAADEFPKATFTADILRAEGENAFTAEGQLTLKGQSVPVTMPFTLKIEGERATMSGGTTLDRRNYNIGEGVQDESSLGFDVDVDVSLTATRAGQ
ncbi:cytochrome b/b6 domain-containing protein [Sediminimonas qiaohouensis]|uniref:cytochrome b/b6 domain-containing protein n=1 Tax=Sediminimonas qiaohouensis TaxID=552061 RepID=UPI0004128AAA|nr:cytochrome b/b6 domain-containing protein [Sediminimonas qiaohouensis]